MFYYNIDGKLQTSPIPIKGQTPVNLTAEQAKICVGFDSQGNPIYDSSILDRENELAKQKTISEIKTAFENACVKTGVALNGIYPMLSGVTINNPKFQYDFDSINKLESVVSDARVGYWRSVDNKNIVLTNQDKQTLLELLKVTYFTKFAESRTAIDNL